MDFSEEPAYTITNEDLRSITRDEVKPQAVLTVAGSGDQALFYKLAGVKIVDTFDITINAGVIQDIKYAAIKHLSRDEYIKLLKKLHTAKTTDMKDLPQIRYLAPFLSRETLNVIEQNKFSACLGPNINGNLDKIPNDEEYTKLKSILETPFNFIHSPLQKLAPKLKKKYDLIYVSNIFDKNIGSVSEILDGLSKHLNPKGIIKCAPQRNDSCIFKQGQKNVEKLTVKTKKSDKIYPNNILFQKEK